MQTNLQKLMADFCNIVMPGHDKKKGYINVTRKVKELGKDRRTYYNWKNGDNVPGLKTMVNLLEARGFELKIVPKFEDINLKGEK